MKPFQRLLQQARRDRPRWPARGELERVIWDELVEDLRQRDQQLLIDRIYGNDILMEEAS